MNVALSPTSTLTALQSPRPEGTAGERQPGQKVDCLLWYFRLPDADGILTLRLKEAVSHHGQTEALTSCTWMQKAFPLFARLPTSRNCVHGFLLLKLP